MAKILGLEIIKKGDFEKLQKTVQKYKDDVTALRPKLDELYLISSDVSGAKVAFYPFPVSYLYQIAIGSDVVRTVLNVKIRESFRKGLKIEPKFHYKCMNCGKEFKHEPQTERCDNCQGTLRQPMEEQKLLIEEKLNKINDNNQTIIDLFKTTEWDEGVVDNGFIIFLKQYFYDNDGKIVTGRIREIIRGDPRVINLIADKKGRRGYNDEGKRVYACPECRDKLYNEDEVNALNAKCPMCHTHLYSAHFSAKEKESNYVYYLDNEVILFSEYNPGLLYGFPPLLSIWRKVQALIFMDNYMMMFYQKQRPPKGLLIINTANYESVKKAWEETKSETRKDPHAISPWIIENKEGRNLAQWIDFMSSLKEMDYGETRNEMRRQIGAIYGVMPMFSGDIQMSGGLNNEGLQMTMTNREIEKVHSIYNKILRKIADEFNVTDYVVELEPSEERDEKADLETMGLKIDNAMKMKNMGFKVVYNEDGENFKFSKEPEISALNSLSSLSQTSNDQRFEGEPRNVKRADSPVTSDTAGVFNPLFSPKRRKFKENVLAAFKSVQEEVEKELNINIIHKAEKSDELVEAITDALFKRKFDGISKLSSDKIKNAILKGILLKQSIPEIMKEIQKYGVTAEQAEVISRTETQAIQLKMREFNYSEADPNDELKYKWIGPEDDRTSEVCKRITKRTNKGVSMSELKNIIDKEAAKDGLVAREWTPHPNCRHTFVRSFK